MLKTLTKELKDIRAVLERVDTQHLYIEDGYLEINYEPENKLYVPTATGERFHASDAFVRTVVGPYGSGKSTMCCMEIAKRACAMPRWLGDARRSKWAIVRNTTGELTSTTLQTWLAWFGELGAITKRQKPILQYEHMFNDGNGIVEIDIIFLALDREEDLRKVRSLELTGVYINEMSEVPMGALAHFKGRVGRYPSRAFCAEPYWAGIIADSNPTDVDHWLHKSFNEGNHPEHTLFRQPPGLLRDDDGKWVRNTSADNAANLPDEYYIRMAQGQTQDFIKVFCLGEWGSVGFGKKVYPEYNDDVHSVDDIEVLENVDIHLGFDFGLTPACVVAQVSPQGQMRLIREYTADNMGVKSFVEAILLPSLRQEFPRNKINISVGDPAGMAADGIFEELSCIGIINTLGIKTEAARTNILEPRLQSVRYFLNRMVDGKAGFIVSRKGCPMLRRGFVKDYCYRRVHAPGEERFRDVPDKNMSSHPHDALQYILMEFAALNISADKQPAQSDIDMFNPTFQFL